MEFQFGNSPLKFAVCAENSNLYRSILTFTTINCFSNMETNSLLHTQHNYKQKLQN